MLNKLLTDIAARFVSPDEVEAYRSMIPNSIHLGYRTEEGELVAYIDEIDDKPVKGALVTQAKNEKELVYNVNQLVYMHIRMPEKIRPYYGNSFPLTSLKKSGELELVKA